MNRSDIRVKAMVVFRRGHQILVNEVRQSNGSLQGYRIPGGHVEFGEHSQQTAIREIKEELSVDIILKGLIGVFENMFTYNNQKGHEVIFVYEGQFLDDSLYAHESLKAFEHTDGQSFTLFWMDPHDTADNKPLFPEGLQQVLLAA